MATVSRWEPVEGLAYSMARETYTIKGAPIDLLYPPDDIRLCQRVAPAQGLPMPNGTCFVVMEWQDGYTRIPIAVCATRAQAEAMQNAFRDIEEAPWERQAQPAQEGRE